MVSHRSAALLLELGDVAAAGPVPDLGGRGRHDLAAAAKQLGEAIAVLMDRQPELLTPTAWKAMRAEQAAAGR